MVMSEKYGIQGDESEVDGRNSNQGNKDIRNNGDIINLTQNDVDRNREERLNQDVDETTSDNGDDKNDEEKFTQINDKVIVSQELKCYGEKKGVNKDKTVILEQTQGITDNSQSESVGKTAETRTSTGNNKKNRSIMVNRSAQRCSWPRAP
jgi:maltoporin